MAEERVVVYVQGSQRVGRVSQWLRRLLPATTLLMVMAAPGDRPCADPNVICVDADDGPLAVVSKVAERLQEQSA